MAGFQQHLSTAMKRPFLTIPEPGTDRSVVLPEINYNPGLQGRILCSRKKSLRRNDFSPNAANLFHFLFIRLTLYQTTKF